MTIQERARLLHAAMERRTRSNGEGFYSLADGAPEWMQDAVYAAHGDMLPDDWRYRIIRGAATALAGGDDPDDPYLFADEFVPHQTADRLSWLSSHAYRASYVDDAVADLGHSDCGVIGDIGMGIYEEAAEVFGLLVSALAELDEDSAED